MQQCQSFSLFSFFLCCQEKWLHEPASHSATSAIDVEKWHVGRMCPLFSWTTNGKVHRWSIAPKANLKTHPTDWLLADLTTNQCLVCLYALQKEVARTRNLKKRCCLVRIFAQRVSVFHAMKRAKIHQRGSNDWSFLMSQGCTWSCLHSCQHPCQDKEPGFRGSCLVC